MAKAFPWSPPTAAAVLVAVACWELAPFAGLRFLTCDAVFDMLGNPPALFLSFDSDFASTTLPIKFGADSWLLLGQTCWFLASKTSQTRCRPEKTVLNDPRIHFLCLQAGGNHDAFLVELAWSWILLGKKVISH
jgi:hypothetical protein